MPLSGKRLAFGSRGYEVALLQAILRRLGQDIPHDEIAQSLYGAGTADAVGRFQILQGSEASNVVDPGTADVINRELAQLGPLLYRIEGKVTNEEGRPAPGLRVAALVRGTEWETVVGDGPLTDATGSYGIQYSADLFYKPVQDGPALVVHVEDERGTVLQVSEPWSDVQPVEVLNLTVSAAQDPMDPTFTVRGTVRGADGVPLVGIIVEAFDADLPSLDRDELLGRTTTDADGIYTVDYTADHFIRAERLSADLLVRAVDTSGDIVASAPVMFNAPRASTIDLIAAMRSGPSEFERLVKAVLPLVVTVPLSRLTEADEAFLVGETGLAADVVASLMLSHRWSEKTDVAPEVFYALLRQNLPESLPALLGAGRSRQASALHASAERNLVPPWPDSSIETILDRLAELLADHLLKAETGKQTDIGRLLATALDGEAKSRTFLSAWGAHLESGKDMADFWPDLRNTHGFSEEDLTTLMLAGELGEITLLDVPLATALLEERRSGMWSHVRDLARRDVKSWAASIGSLASTNPAALPPWLDGKDTEEKVRSYAAMVADQVAQRYPTAVLAARLEGEPDFPMEGREDVLAFFARQPEFELATTHLPTYFAERGGEALPSGVDKDRLENRLEGIQRMIRLAPTEAGDLLRAGFTSAYAIDALDSEQFVEGFAGVLGGPECAAEIHRAAEQQSAAAAHLFTDLATSNVDRLPRLLPNFADSVENAIPDLRRLFGSLDACACSHCQSVLGPAAYLVDVLEFLRGRRVNNGSRSALDVLLERRPDLGEIELTCTNTDTELPYLDLVNEVLENAVYPVVRPEEWQHRPISADKHELFQTRRTAEELELYPEHVNLGAYRRLREAVRPWTLPFDLWGEERRGYLNVLGTSRTELVEIFRVHESSSPAAVAAVAQDVFGLNERAFAVSATADDAGREDVWGPGDLSSVPTFLQRSGLTPAELIELLATRFVNPDIANPDVRLHPPEGCDLEQLHLVARDGTPLRRRRDGAVLDRIHRFVRVWRATDWPMDELDRAVRALGSAPGSKLDGECLLRLAELDRLQARLGMTRAQLLVFWAPLQIDPSRPIPGNETKLASSPYETVFREPGPDGGYADPALDPAQLGAGARLRDHRPAVMAALGLVSADLDRLIAILPGATLPDASTPNRAVDAPLSLDTLSSLRRHALLARSLGLSVQDLLRLKALTGKDPFVAADPAATRDFCRLTERARGSRCSVPELAYLWLTEPESSRLAPATETVARILVAVRSAVRAAQEQIAPTRDADGEGTGFLSSGGRDGRELGTDATVEALAPALGLSPDMLRPLLTTHARAVGSTAPLIDVFLGAGFARSNPDTVPADEPPFSAAFAAVRLLHRVALLLTRLRVQPNELPRLYAPAASGTRTNRPDLNLLAEVGTQGYRPEDSLALWLRLTDLFRLRDRFGSVGLAQVIARATAQPADPTAIVTALQAWTGWRPRDVSFLAEQQRWNLSGPDFADEVWLARLAACFDLLGRLGVSADEAWGWTAPDLSDEIAARRVADGARRALQAKRSGTEWAGVARPVRDRLRERQAAALSAFLLASPPPSGWTMAWREPEDLHARFLADARMGACRVSSRLQFAHATVQLFAQRCFLNLEPDIRVDATRDRGWTRWQWMKSYRLWKAARRVFLYPENLIPAASRDDRTPFFVELENNLRRDELTSEAAEVAFEQYVERLAEVSRLEIVAFCREPNPDGTLHLFGRTRHTPHVYFHRSRRGGGISAAWTPWERVDADIDSDHLIPVFWSGHLHLFWPVLTDQTERVTLTEPAADRRNDERPTGTARSEPVEVTRTTSKLQLAWSMRRRGQWTAKRIAEAFAIVPQASEADFYFDTQYTDQGDLRVICHFAVLYGAFSVWPAVPANSGRENASALSREGRAARARRSQASETRRTTPSVAGPRWAREASVSFQFSRLDGSVRRLDFVGTPFPRLPPGTYPDGRVFAEDPPNPPAGTFEVGAFRFVPVNTPEGRGDEAALPEVEGSQPNPTFGRSDQAYRAVPTVDVRTDDRLIVELAHGADVTVLNMLPEGFGQRGANRFRLIQEHPGPQREFLYQDSGRTFFAELSLDAAQEDSLLALLARAAGLPDGSQEQRAAALMAFLFAGGSAPKFRFTTHYHPFAGLMLWRLSSGAVEDVIQRRFQLEPHATAGIPAFDFDASYRPVRANVHTDQLPVEELAFRPLDAYAPYNWELFFHAPFLIATRLSQEQRFEDAQRWFHFIFDPTDVSSEEEPGRYWQTRPFNQRAQVSYQYQRIQEMLRRLARGEADPELAVQIARWRDDALNPYPIARLRTTAFQKAVVMGYVDLLIRWGDAKFREETLEALNEATQLYLFAADILGEPSSQIRRQANPAPQTYYSLAPSLDRAAEGFGNALVRLENLVSPPKSRRTAIAARPTDSWAPWRTSSERKSAPIKPVFDLYFCVGPNEELDRYRLIVAERLLKIRTCQNIEGEILRPPLFGDMLDSDVLGRARRAGDLGTMLPHYRFQPMLQMALQFCGEVRGLGSALLVALEKHDGEALARLRSGHEMSILERIREIRHQQVDEAKKALTALERARVLVQTRRDHYVSLARVSAGERSALAQTGEAIQMQVLAREVELGANALHLIPNTKVAAPTSAGFTFGGDNLGQALEAFAKYAGSSATIKHAEAGVTATLAGYDRRKEEWDLQVKLAVKELEQIDMQIEAAIVRRTIVEKEEENHLLQERQSREVDEFLRTKYGNFELYDWMKGELARLYSEAYQLAFDLAKGAERAFQFERGEPSSFVTYGHWDGLYSGLLAGERLAMELHRMETSYLRKNRREHELTKQISLALHDPLALHLLRTEGSCGFELPESLFDLDHPGHYMRRIKSVALTLPAIVGPYTSVNARLTLESSRVRRDPTSEGGYPESRTAADPRFAVDRAAVVSIATSRAHADTGLFELSFRDERYLPFEGAGAISRWRLELNPDCNDFDLATLADVVLELRYTARDGGDDLRRACVDQVVEPELARPRVRMFSARTDFADAWHAFLHPIGDASEQTLVLDLDRERFPFRAQRGQVTLSELRFVLLLEDPKAHLGDGVPERERYPTTGIPVSIRNPATPGNATPTATGALASTGDSVPEFAPDLSSGSGLGAWRLSVSQEGLATLPPWLAAADLVSGQRRLADEAIADLLAFATYRVERDSARP